MNYYKGEKNYYNVGQILVITKWDNQHYKVGRVVLLQSGTSLLQKVTGITKCGNYYKVVLGT